MEIKSCVKSLIDKPVILDIGTNKGKEIRNLFLKYRPRAKIFAFEADVRSFRKLKKRYGKDKRCTLINMGVFDIDGEKDFYLSSSASNDNDDYISSSSLLTPHKIIEAAPHLKFTEKVKVKTTTLDTWYKQQGVGVIDLIWADVQGAEAYVIRGGKKTLSNTRFFYTEFCTSEYYKGQSSLDDILSLLPDFVIMDKCMHNDDKYTGDILLRNTKL